MIYRGIKEELQAAPFDAKTWQKPHQVHHPISAMMSFLRIVVPEHERFRWITHVQTQKRTK
jgi:hypothetical protein